MTACAVPIYGRLCSNSPCEYKPEKERKVFGDDIPNLKESLIPFPLWLMHMGMIDFLYVQALYLYYENHISRLHTIPAKINISFFY